jgi:hypothetical protein
VIDARPPPLPQPHESHDVRRTSRYVPPKVENAAGGVLDVGASGECIGSGIKLLRPRVNFCSLVPPAKAPATVPTDCALLPASSAVLGSTRTLTGAVVLTLVPVTSSSDVCSGPVGDKSPRTQHKKRPLAAL